MANTSVYAGITQGLGAVADYERERPARDLRMQEAKARQQRSQLQLEQEMAMAPLKQSAAELELEQLQMQVKQEKRSRLKNETFNAFKSYNADGETRHLNNFLQSAKQMGDPTWSHWSRFDPMTRTPQTEAMLGQAGITDLDDYFSDPELVKSKVLATDANGQQSLLDMNVLQQGTGYTQYMTTEELKQARERASIDKLLMGTQSAETNFVHQIAEQEGISLLQAHKLYKENVGQQGGSTIERVARKLMNEDPELTFANALQRAARLQASPSGAEKDIAVTETVRNNLHALSPTGSFYDLDLSDPKMRERAGELIVDLEKASGKKWDSATKKVARQLNSLLKLGAAAGDEMSAEETGILDNMLHKVKKYFTDSTDGVKATAAYELYRNIQRNALYGATLPAGEIRAFNAAMGSLNMQLGPVLEQMQVSMQDTKAQLQAVMDFEDPMVVKYRLGMTMEEAEAAVDAMDERLELFKSYESKHAGKSLTLKDIRSKQAPKVEVNVPVQATPAGSKPEVSAAERWKQIKGGMNEG